MPSSSFYRSYHSLSNLLLEVSRYKPEWQRELVHHLHANYGHDSPSSALSAKRKNDMGELQQILWSNFQKAFKLTKTGGRPSNHQRAVRDILLTVLAADMPTRLHYLGNPIVGASDMRKFVSRLSSLVDGTGSAVFFEARGKERSDKTSDENETLARLHWQFSGVESPNKKDLIKKGDQAAVVCHYYDRLNDIHQDFLKRQQKAQLQEWREQSSGLFESIAAPVTLSMSFYRRNGRTKREFFGLVLLEDATVIPYQHIPLVLPPNVFHYNSVCSAVPSAEGDDEPWVKVKVLMIADGDVTEPGNGPYYIIVPILLIRTVECPGQLGALTPERENAIADLSKVFHMSFGVFYRCKPFNMRKGSRETCLCVYHLRWDFLCEGLWRFYKAILGEDHERSSDLLKLLSNSSDLRKKLMCEQDGDGFNKVECLKGTCSTCGGFKLFLDVFKGSGLLPAGSLGFTPDVVAEEGEDGMVDVGGDEDVDLGTPVTVAARTAADWTEGANLKYEAWTKVSYFTRDGESREKFDFAHVERPLRDYWTDVGGYYYRFMSHHDLGKHCDGAWGSGKEFPRRKEGKMVMDASEAHTHRRRRENQSAYFQQLQSHLWVVCIRTHIDDMKMDESERARLKALMDKRQGDGDAARHILRQTWVYITNDGEKDQAQVQLIVKDVVNYLTGQGRWSDEATCCSSGCGLESGWRSGENNPEGCSSCDGIARNYSAGCEHSDPNLCPHCEKEARYYDRPGLSEREYKESHLYEGQAAPSDECGKFTWLYGQSDGCAAQFMCAVFLYFLSLIFTLSGGMHVVWNWFCSCHGKCDCDPEGGAVKRAADEYENTDSKKSTESKIIRNSHELVDFCRSQLTTTKKTFNGTGVWQRKFHELHVGGNGFVANRRLVRKADSKITTYSSDLATKPTTKVKIKTIRRAASTGYPGVLWASERSCNKQGTCPCSGFVGSGVRDFAKCISGPASVCQQIQITPSTAVPPTPTRGSLAERGAQIGRDSTAGDFVAMETMSNECTFWILQVKETAAPVPPGYEPPDLHCDVELDYPRNKLAIKVSRLRPKKTARGVSLTEFDEDNTTGSFLAPCHLLRLGKIPMKAVQLPPLRRGRSSSSSSSSTNNERPRRFELPASSKGDIYSLCRVHGD